MKKRPRNYLDINGTPGDDVLIGTPADDTIDGGAGNDTLIGEGGADTLIGGAGDDDFRVETMGDDVIESVGGGFDRVYSNGDYNLDPGQEIELLSYINPSAIGPGDYPGILLRGNEFAQTIIGSAGPDGIAGFGGNDVLAGGLGDDDYVVEDAGDVVLEYEGGGFDWVHVDVAVGSYALQAGFEIERLGVLQFSGTLGMTLIGNEYANRIEGTRGSDTLIGGGGNDKLTGDRGSDFYRVEDWGDVIVETSLRSNPSDVDSVYVAMHLSGYALANDAHVEVLGAIDPALTVDFDLSGNVRNNIIYGSAGRNVLIGGSGIDVMVGFGGNDFYRVEEEGDLVLETAGNGFDSIYTTTHYTLPAGSAIELLAAIDPSTAHLMHLWGNEFANEIYGNASGSIIDGKAGSDLLFGGGGGDTFAFTTAFDLGDIDTIIDFAAGVDEIGLDNAIFPFVGGPAPLNPNAFVIGTAAADADDRVIYNQATGQLFYDYDGTGAAAAVHFATLVGAPTLAASDFEVI